MSAIKFLPWVGEAYSEAFYGKRILILGESHYCPKGKEHPTMTQEVIRGLSDPEAESEGYKITFTKFVRALEGSSIKRTQQEQVWQRVMFYNYVQEAMSYARVKPTAEQYSKSERAFFEVLNLYHPESIIVWGKRLYNFLPQKGEQGPDVYGIETWIYKLDNGEIVRILPITHPSAAFSPSEWHKIIMAFLHLK